MNPIKRTVPITVDVTAGERPTTSPAASRRAGTGIEPASQPRPSTVGSTISVPIGFIGREPSGGGAHRATGKVASKLPPRWADASLEDRPAVLAKANVVSGVPIVPIALVTQAPPEFIPIVAKPVEPTIEIPMSTTSADIPVMPAPTVPPAIQIATPSPTSTFVPPSIFIPTSGGASSVPEGAFEATVSAPEAVLGAETVSGGGFSVAAALGGGAVGFVAAGPVGAIVGLALGYFAGRAKGV